jgi:hypothetical protein
LASNRKEVLKQLKAYRSELEKVESLLKEQGSARLKTFFEVPSRLRRRLSVGS